MFPKDALLKREDPLVKDKKHGSYLKTLDNAFDVLELFSLENPEMGVSEISERLGLHKSIVFRILYTLKVRGYVEQSDETRKFRLGLKCFEVGSRTVNQLGLGSLIQPIIEKLALSVNDTVNVGVLNGTDIVYLNKVVSQSPLRIEAQTGARFPAHCTALGKAILAYLPVEQLENYLENSPFNMITQDSLASPEDAKKALAEVRKQGYSWSDQELFEGITCIGAPVFDRRGKVFAAISIAMLRHRAYLPGRKEELIKLITLASSEISNTLKSTTYFS